MGCILEFLSTIRTRMLGGDSGFRITCIMCLSILVQLFNFNTILDFEITIILKFCVHFIYNYFVHRS